MNIKGGNILNKLSKNGYQVLLPILKEEKTRAFTTLAFTLIALSVFGFFAINPTLSTIVRLQKELSDNQFVDKKLTEKINNLSILQAKYKLLENDLSIILQALPQTPSAPLFAAQVQSIAAKSNVSISRLQVFQVELSGGKKKTLDSSFAFSLETVGFYPDISAFLTSLVNSQRIVTIDTLSIVKATDFERSGMLQLNLRGRVYFKN